jgi:hypothetical protein
MYMVAKYFQVGCFALQGLFLSGRQAGYIWSDDYDNQLLNIFY